MPGLRSTSSSPDNWPTRTSTPSWRSTLSCRMILLLLNKFLRGPMFVCLARRAFALKPDGLLIPSGFISGGLQPGTWWTKTNVGPVSTRISTRTGCTFIWGLASLVFNTCDRQVLPWNLCLGEAVRLGNRMNSSAFALSFLLKDPSGPWSPSPRTCQPASHPTRWTCFSISWRLSP